MTSNYAKNHGLSQETLSLWKSIGDPPRDVADRLRFYLSYLSEVVPYGVTVHHLPNRPSSSTGHPPRRPSSDPRQEIQFWLGTGKIFMAGLISMEINGVNAEHPATDDAYAKLYDEDIVSDNGTWRLFSGGAQLRMYNCHRINEYELTGFFNPIENAGELAAHLQREYDSMMSKSKSGGLQPTVDEGDLGKSIM